MGQFDFVFGKLYIKEEGGRVMFVGGRRAGFIFLGALSVVCIWRRIAGAAKC